MFRSLPLRKLFGNHSNRLAPLNQKERTSNSCPGLRYARESVFSVPFSKRVKRISKLSFRCRQGFFQTFAFVCSACPRIFYQCPLPFQHQEYFRSISIGDELSSPKRFHSESDCEWLFLRVQATPIHDAKNNRDPIPVHSEL